jgi:serine/threonine protein kinase
MSYAPSRRPQATTLIDSHTDMHFGHSIATAALAAPTFKTSAYPHLQLGKFIGAGVYKVTFHLKLCTSPATPCISMKDPITQHSLIIKLPKPGLNPDDSYGHMQMELKRGNEIRDMIQQQQQQQQHHNVDTTEIHRLDIFPVAVFDFPINDLLQSPFSVASFPSKMSNLSQWNARSYCAEIWYGSRESPSSFTSYTAMASFYSDFLLAVNALHTTGYSHYDIKLDNLRVSQSNVPLLIDFASARVQPDVKFDDIFRAGVMLLDWLYHPCIMIRVTCEDKRKVNPQIKLSSDFQNHRHEWANNIKGSPVAKGGRMGWPVTSRYTAPALALLNLTVHKVFLHKKPARRCRIHSLLAVCPSGFNEETDYTIEKRDVELDTSFLDLALRLMAKDISEQASITSARNHSALTLAVQRGIRKQSVISASTSAKNTSRIIKSD